MFNFIKSLFTRHEKDCAAGLYRILECSWKSNTRNQAFCRVNGWRR